jgi:hypothetical protein
VAPGETFDLIEQAVASGGPASALDLLARKFLAEKQYPPYWPQINAHERE